MHGNIWADHIITEVREKNGIITDVKLGADRRENRPNVKIEPLSYVLLILSVGRSIVTAHQDHTGNYRKGASVEKYTINGKEHIRSNPNQKTIDNLDSLPRF